ncbi:MAG: hypothetical protein KDC34_02575 [Saprospiraceae bacterium]|nr:hypothetical protein [Saprospiraceae bacterium]
MNTRYLVILFFPVVLSLGSCSNNAGQESETMEETPPHAAMEAVDVPPGFVPFVDESDGFGLALPANWEIAENYSGTRFLAKSPRTSQNDLFQENVNLIVQPLAGSGVSTLEEYVALSKVQLKNFITDFELLESRNTTWAGYPAHEFIYTGTQGAYNLKWQQLLYLDGSTAYVFSYTALPDTYNQFVAIIEMISNSFKFAGS